MMLNDCYKNTIKCNNFVNGFENDENGISILRGHTFYCGEWMKKGRNLC